MKDNVAVGLVGSDFPGESPLFDASGVFPDFCSVFCPDKSPNGTAVGDDLMQIHLQHAVPLAKAAEARRFEPAQVQAEFPERWQLYIRACYRNLNHVSKVFNVSERTARKWWDGETGCKGAQVVIAVEEHPVEARRMLFAAE